MGTIEGAVSRNAIERAINLYGSQEGLADAVGYSQHAIWRAKEVGHCSPGLAIKIEIATKGKIRKEELASRDAFRLRKPLRRRRPEALA